jgi:hypothetical protein
VNTGANRNAGLLGAVWPWGKRVLVAEISPREPRRTSFA